MMFMNDNVEIPLKVGGRVGGRVGVKRFDQAASNPSLLNRGGQQWMVEERKTKFCPKHKVSKRVNLKAGCFR